MTDAASFWKSYPNVDYTGEIAERTVRLRYIRAHPEELPALREFYRRCPWIFIAEWGWTNDTREIAKGKGALIPFVPWPKQLALIEWMYTRWRNAEDATTVKSRDVGASYCAMALLATLCVLERDFAGGVVSATEVKLDQVGNPDTLLGKARLFLRNLPQEFAGGYDEAKHSSHLRILIPQTGGSLVGETGDNAGRGSRKAIVIADESSHYLHPKVTDAALIATTPCRIDLSSVNGMANSFYERAHNPDIARFDLTWRDDPRRDEAWAEAKRRTTDPVIWAAEYDCDFSASVSGQLIPAAHVASAIGLRGKLGLPPPSGAKCASYDPADTGADKNAVAVRHGSSLVHMESWSGRGKDLHKSTAHVFAVCDRYEVRTLHVDVDGLGSGVKGTGAALNEHRRDAGRPAIEVLSYRGSAAPFDPDGSLLEGVSNRDGFLNQKAMTGFALAGRFEYTHRVVEAHTRGERIEFDPGDLIDIPADLPELNVLVSELSAPAYSYTAAGKRAIDKQPDGILSPNLYDALAILFSPAAVGGYFSGVRVAASSASSEPAAPTMPMWLDKLFAALVIMEDTAAIVYCGSLDAGGDGSRGVGLWILDYDLQVLAEGADQWLVGLDDQLRDLADATPAAWHARLMGTYMDDFEQGWANALAQLGVVTNVVGEELPPLAERYNKARPYIARGLCALGPVAARKEVAYKGSRRNFLREVVTASAPPESSALALAFATAALLTYHGRASIPTPTLTPQQFPRPPKPPPPLPPSALMWQTATGCWREGPVPADHKGAVARRGDLGF